MGWIALTPLLVALTTIEAGIPKPTSHALRRAFALGLTTGIVYFTGTLYWITQVMVVYGGLHPWVAVLVNAALVAYLALFPAVFAIVVRRLAIASETAGAMASPLVWVTTELGRTRLFSGFPWVLLGYSQVTVLPIAQLASVFGVYGVSALVAAVSAALALAARAFASPRAIRSGRALLIPCGAVAGALVLTAVWGSVRAGRSEWTRQGEALRVGLVQGNVDQADKFDATRATAIFQDYLDLTRRAISAGAQLVVWPESSTPFNFEEDHAGAERIKLLARQARVPILVGSDQIERGVQTRYYNAAFLVRSDGSTDGVYRKMHLVPFGEYVPLKRLLFFAAPLVQAVSDYSEGETRVLLPVDGHPISTAICYEIVYPDLVRRFVSDGSELLTTITNDAWFGRTSAPYQHFAQASMRAVENGRYLVRSANTGISGVVDPYGRVVLATAIFERTVVVADARFLRVSTFYARHGDVFAYGSGVATVAMLLASRRRSSGLGRPAPVRRVQ